MSEKATFSKGDPLWEAIKGKFMVFGSGSVDPVRIGVTYDVLGVGVQGKPIEEVRRTRASLEVDIVSGGPFYAAAIAFAAKNEGQKNLGRVVVEISVFNPEGVPTKGASTEKKVWKPGELTSAEARRGSV